MRRQGNLLQTGELNRDLWSPLSNISESFLCAGTTLLTVHHRPGRWTVAITHTHTDAPLYNNTAAAMTPHLSRGCLKRVIIITLYFGDGWMGAG